MNRELKIISDLKEIAVRSIKKGKYEKALSAINAGCNILYQYNQYYVDEDFESDIARIAAEMLQRNILKTAIPQYNALDDILPAKTILFYDGFGIDNRGLAKDHLRTFGEIGSHVVYVSLQSRKAQLEETRALVRKYNFTEVYIDNQHGQVKYAQALNKVFEDARPEMAYFYTTPYDAAGALAFKIYENRVRRILINLTDHAFWLGRDSVDYIYGTREHGIGICVFDRGVSPDQIISTRTYYFPPECDFAGWPCDCTGKRIIFSGGSLYKTLGDAHLLYYQIVNHILENHQDIIFVYAGSGDDREMKKLMGLYPDRVFLIGERPDFYQMIERCTLYLNTYPMFGGMMMRYSVIAGKLPITLRHNNESDGMIPNQENLQITYDTYDELIADVDKLLDNDAYLRSREERLKRAEYDKETYLNDFRTIINTGCSPIRIPVIRQDTTEFRREYLQRFDVKSAEESSIATSMNKVLVTSFPQIFVSRCLKKYLIK